MATYFAAATQAALVLAAFRAPYRGRSTPVNAWWGSFDLAVNLFSGRPADPPSDDFIMRNAMDSQEVAVGWWPGDARYGKAAFYAYAHPAPEGFADATLSPAAARWDAALGEYVLDWDDVVAAADPHALALEFARSAFRHACLVCGWSPRARGERRGQRRRPWSEAVSDSAPASAAPERHAVARDERHLRIARDLVAVEGGDDVPVEAQPAGGGGLAHGRGRHASGIAAHRARGAQRPEDADRDLGRRSARVAAS